MSLCGGREMGAYFSLLLCSLWNFLLRETEKFHLLLKFSNQDHPVFVVSLAGAEKELGLISLLFIFLCPLLCSRAFLDVLFCFYTDFTYGALWVFFLIIVI